MIYQIEEDKEIGLRRFVLITIPENMEFEDYIKERDLKVAYSNDLQALILIPNKKETIIKETTDNG